MPDADNKDSRYAERRRPPVACDGVGFSLGGDGDGKDQRTLRR